MERPPEIDWPKATMTPATMALEVPVLHPSAEWRAAFKRLAWSAARTQRKLAGLIRRG